MAIYLWLVGLYILVGLFICYKTPFVKESIHDSKKFTSDYFKTNKLSDKLQGVSGYFLLGIIILLFFSIYPILFLVSYISNNEWQFKKKVFPPKEIQKKYRGIDTPETITLTHPNNFFNLKPTQVLYIENEYNYFLNDYFTKHFDKVQLILTEIHAKCGLNRELIYIPRIIDELKKNNNLNNVLSYYFPCADNDGLQTEISSFQTTTLTKLIFENLNYFGEISSGFIRIHKNKDGNKVFNYSYVKLDATNEKELQKILYYFFSNDVDVVHEVFYRMQPDNFYIKSGLTYELADFGFDYEAHKLAQEVKTNIEKLVQSGAQHLLLNVLGRNYFDNLKSNYIGSREFSRLIIEKDFKIILPDYNNLEIELTPLPKTVFLFFLLHPEGVMLKHLCDHRNELLEIYKQLSYRETWDEVNHSIDELIDPTKNSINEKCSRIKEAFLKNFEDRLSQYYYITGDRGQEKGIKLNRDLIIWNIDKSILPMTVPSKSVKTSDEIEIQVNEYYNKGKENLSKMNSLEAIEQLTKVLELNQYHFNAISMRAIAYSDIGNYQQAILDNNQAIALHPQINIAHHNRAEARLMIKDFDGALEDINKYLTNVDNKCGESYFIRGLIKMEKNDIQGACQDWFTAKHLNHPNAEGYLLRYPEILISEPIFENLN